MEYAYLNIMVLKILITKKYLLDKEDNFWRITRVYE